MAPTSEIHIQATDTDPVLRAQTAIGEHHEQLRTKLATLAGAVTLAESAGSEGAPSARTELREFATGELRQWLAASDEALYTPAAAADTTRLLVQSLRIGTAALDRHIEALAAADDDALAQSAARSLTSSLDLHLTIEQGVLLPALAELPGADLPGRLADLTTVLAGGELKEREAAEVRESPQEERRPVALCDTRALTEGRPGRSGALWKLAESGRQLDANLVHLPPHERVGVHAEPELDVLLHVIAGGGTLGTGGGADTGKEPLPPLAPGTLLWLPHGSVRELGAGPEGLSYLTVHTRRPGIRIQNRPPGA